MTIERDGWSEAIRDVLAERRRQIEEEGWTPEHDDEHPSGEIAMAAATYAIDGTIQASAALGGVRPASVLWPWDDSWYKPTNRRRDLVKAGALILAEIERLDRALKRSAPAKESDNG